MELRVRKRDSHRFFGCAEFPDCRGAVSEAVANGFVPTRTIPPRPWLRNPHPQVSDALDDLDYRMGLDLDMEWRNCDGEWVDC